VGDTVGAGISSLERMCDAGADSLPLEHWAAWITAGQGGRVPSEADLGKLKNEFLGDLT